MLNCVYVSNFKKKCADIRVLQKVLKNHFNTKPNEWKPTFYPEVHCGLCSLDFILKDARVNTTVRRHQLIASRPVASVESKRALHRVH